MPTLSSTPSASSGGHDGRWRRPYGGPRNEPATGTNVTRRLRGIDTVTSSMQTADSRTRALHDPSLYTNRELSWLEFNQRVLDQAIGDDHPLLERVKFLGIVASNLDEFFMVRVATLRKRQRAGLEQVSPDGLTVSEQLTAIRTRALKMMRDLAACWQDRLRPALAEAGVTFLEEEQYTDRIRRHLAAYFRSDVFPLLTP